MDRSDFIKLGVSIALDILDFTLGRITGAGTVLDLVFAAVAVALWGPARSPRAPRRINSDNDLI